MMLHRDGSRRAWLEGATPFDLIVTLDDATGTIYSAFLVEEEGAASTFRALKKVFGEHGLPHTLNGFRPAHLTCQKGQIDRTDPAIPKPDILSAADRLAGGLWRQKNRRPNIGAGRFLRTKQRHPKPTIQRCSQTTSTSLQDALPPPVRLNKSARIAKASSISDS